MKRKKKHEEHVDESWLIPYADILTLLLALFIVLFAASEVDSKKFEAISQAFNSELEGGTGVLEQQAAVETFEETSPIPEVSEENPAGKSKEEIAVEQDFKELGDLQEKVETYIKEKGLAPRLQTKLTAKGLLLTIKEGVLYTPGSADMSAEAQKIAVEISNLLITDKPRFIYIEGHTDNVPVAQSGKYPSNWELSAGRAINFMKLLLENDQLDPKKFSATGYGEFQPLTSNKTEKGRAENRRVEVLISPYTEEKE
ncbi:flagellar motor protein MotB [Planococcus sp. YIM B11945]|uniref:flagellar motor protein MotB n=1 Tax=Planococcus sp. YIM B11945 TaxID=3435410 RepID=UPI003D7EA0F1